MLQMLMSLGVLQAGTASITQKDFAEFLAGMNQAQQRKDLSYIKAHTSMDIVYATRDGMTLNFNTLVSQVLRSFKTADKLNVHGTVIKFVTDHAIVEDLTEMTFRDSKGKSHTLRIRSRNTEYVRRENGVLKYIKIQEMPVISISRDGKVLRPSAPGSTK